MLCERRTPGIPPRGPEPGRTQGRPGEEGRNRGLSGGTGAVTAPGFGVIVREVFPATHQLPLPQGGFEPLHGHDWEAVVELKGKRLDRQGLLVDFLDLQKSLRETLKPLRYKCLNDLKLFE